MTPTTRQLTIMANTVELYLTAEEQRLGWSYLAGVYDEPRPYRAKGCKAAHEAGQRIARKYPDRSGLQRMAFVRITNKLSDRINERHSELDQ